MLDTYLDWKKHSNTKLEKNIFLRYIDNTDNKIRLKILKIVDSQKNKTISTTSKDKKEYKKF